MLLKARTNICPQQLLLHKYPMQVPNGLYVLTELLLQELVAREGAGSLGLRR